MAKRTTPAKQRSKEREQYWEDALRQLEQLSKTDLSFLDQLGDDISYRDEVLRLPYEEPDSAE